MTATPIASFDGFGLGLRTPHYQDFLTSAVPVDFVEVISENFMIDGGRPRHILDQIRERHPVALHGVSMSVGSADGLDRAYLARLKTLIDHVDPLFVSDHLCWTRIAGFNAHDLLPLPYTDEALDLVCANILQAQDVLERAMLIENPSTYLQFTADSMTEWQFLDAGRLWRRVRPDAGAPLSRRSRSGGTGLAGPCAGPDVRGTRCRSCQRGHARGGGLG